MPVSKPDQDKDRRLMRQGRVVEMDEESITLWLANYENREEEEELCIPLSLLPETERQKVSNGSLFDIQLEDRDGTLVLSKMSMVIKPWTREELDRAARRAEKIIQMLEDLRGDG